MGYSGIETLFGEPAQSKLRPTTFLVSVLVHGAVFSLISIQMLEKHRIIERFPQNRFSVRVLNFHSSESQTRQAAGGGIVFHGAETGASHAGELSASRSSTHFSAKDGAGPAAGQVTSEAASLGSPALTRLTPQRMPAPQTLLQPDLPEAVILPQKAIVPLVVLWTPEKVTPKKIVLPNPDRAAIAVARPSLEMPIKEENLADLKLASSAFVTQGPTVPPSTTSPVVVHGPEESRKVPETTSKQLEPPTPSRVLSLSDTRVAEGKVTLPLANQTAKATAGNLIPGQLKNANAVGNGSSSSKVGDKGEGKGEGDRPGGKNSGATVAGSAGAQTSSGKQPGGSGPAGPNAAAGASGASVTTSGTARATSGLGGSPGGPAAGQQAGTVAPSGGASAPQTGASAGAAAGSASGSGGNQGAGESSSTVHISLPKDGQFGVVVFGSSIAERYPETAEMWSGRMASTVYLRVGQPKSWILQYALPRLEDAAHAGGGHIEAPWPFEIARPTIDPADMDADAVILHGFVNKDGRFEKLQVVFPSPLTQAPMIESTLNQWQFRPAKQNGQATPVEVLLIIPDQSQ